MITEQTKNLLGYERTFATATEAIKQKGFQEAVVIVLNSSSHIVCAKKDAGWIPFFQDPQVGDIFAEVIVRNQFSDSQQLVGEIDRHSLKLANEYIRESLETIKSSLLEINKMPAGNTENIETLILINENLSLFASTARTSSITDLVNSLQKTTQEMVLASENHKAIRRGILSVDNDLKAKLLSSAETKNNLQKGLSEFQEVSLREFRTYKISGMINFQELVVNFARGMNLDQAFSIFSIKMV
jgi:hypothetical protein